MYSVEIKLPNPVAANALAIIAENGRLGELINEHLESVDLTDDTIQDCYAEVEFSDRINTGGTHSVTFEI